MLARLIFVAVISLGLTSSGSGAPRSTSLRHAREVHCYETAKKRVRRCRS